MSDVKYIIKGDTEEFNDCYLLLRKMRIKRNCANCIKKYRCIKSPYFGKGVRLNEDIHKRCYNRHR